MDALLHAACESFLGENDFFASVPTAWTSPEVPEFFGPTRWTWADDSTASWAVQWSSRGRCWFNG